MRLWSYQLLPYLPRLQLISQWRECCCIAKSITEKGTPNHILVNKIMDYPIDHFMTYCNLVAKEMYNRGYKCNSARLTKWTKQLADKYTLVSSNDLFSEWHNDMYLRESLYNLEEKALCQGIPADEWQVIYNRFKDFTPLWEGE
jgi:uncharacterized protein (TIGR02328 family)